MFAFKLKLEFAIRIFLVMVVLINALAPTAILAKSSPVQSESVNSLENRNGKERNEALSSTGISAHQQRFSHPISRVNENQQQSESSLAQTYDAMIVCMQGICSDPGPAPVLTEVMDSNDMSWHSFRIQCPASPCASRDIYWQVSMEFTFGNAHPSPPVIPFYATINGGSQSIAFGQMGTGGVDNVFCGNAVFGAPPTKCNMQSSGVIPKEIINGDPNMI